MRAIKIFFSVVFVLAVGFFVARSSVHREISDAGVDFPLEVDSLLAGKRVPTPVLPEVARGTRPIPADRAPRMAIILDDWGYRYNPSTIRSAIEIGRPLTLAVLPGLRYSRQVAEEAHRHGLGVMLHMPMQPVEAHVPLERRTLLTSMPEAEILLFLNEVLKSVPYAEGVNNHMGSAATADTRVMTTVLGALKDKGLFFVDSDVTSKTVGFRVAGRVKIPFTKRDVFLDNEMSVSAIKERLREAKRIALKRGRVVAIGHDRKKTLVAIREMVPEIEKDGVRLVLVKELLEKWGRD